MGYPKLGDWFIRVHLKDEKPECFTGCDVIELHKVFHEQLANNIQAQVVGSWNCSVFVERSGNPVVAELAHFGGWFSEDGAVWEIHDLVMEAMWA